MLRRSSELPLPHFRVKSPCEGGWYPYGEAGRNNPGGRLQRRLPASTSYYVRAKGKRRVFVLDEKPDLLKHLDTVDQRAWKQYETYLKRVTPLEKAEFFRRLRDQGKYRSICALARAIGKSEAHVRQHLALLELPGPVLDFLREHRTPVMGRHFSEDRLRDLLKLGNPWAIWRRFQEMVKEAQESAGIWAKDSEARPENGSS